MSERDYQVKVFEHETESLQCVRDFQVLLHSSRTEIFDYFGHHLETPSRGIFLKDELAKLLTHVEFAPNSSMDNPCLINFDKLNADVDAL